MSYRPDFERRSQSLRKDLELFDSRGGVARLLAAVLFEVIKQCGSGRKAGPPRCHHGSGLFHRGACFCVRHLELKWECLLDHNAAQEQANRVGHRQAHGSQRLGRLQFRFIVDAYVKH